MRFVKVALAMAAGDGCDKQPANEGHSDAAADAQIAVATTAFMVRFSSYSRKKPDRERRAIVRAR
eukprot:291104-Prymnesium_polylepis.1